MDRIHLPEHLGGETHEVTHLVPPKRHPRETGTGWARALTAAQVVDLVDLAGALAVYFPPLKARRVTETPFFNRLEKASDLEMLNSQLIRITGSLTGISTLYYIWWAYTWVFNYTRASSTKDRTEIQAREETAERMGLTLNQAQQRLARRDVSYVVNLFLSRRAREMRGQVEWKITTDALEGGVRDKEMYMRNIAGAEKEEALPEAHEINAEAMAESELKLEISKLKDSVGEAVDIPAEVEIKDVEFEQS